MRCSSTRKKLIHYLNFISLHIDHGINRSSIAQWMENRTKTDRRGREVMRECLSVNECLSMPPHYCHQRKMQNIEVEDNLSTPILVFNCLIHASPVLGTTWRWVVKSGRHPYSLAFRHIYSTEQSRVNSGMAQREWWELQTLGGKSNCIHSSVAFLPHSFSFSSSPREWNTGD